MGLLDTLLSAGAGGAANKFASQYGITRDQATSALKAMVPALAAGIQEKLTGGNATALSGMLGEGALSPFAENPQSAVSPEGIEQGKSLLSAIFGDHDLTGLTGAIAEKSGLGSGLVGKMLPAVAALLGGYLSRQALRGGDSLTNSLHYLTEDSQGIIGAVRSMFAKIPA